MIGFSRAAQQLLCDGVPLSAIAEAEGTPVYVYSAAVLRERYRAIDNAFGSYPHRLHYALKANSTLAVAQLLQAAVSSGAVSQAVIDDAAKQLGIRTAAPT